MKRATGLRRLSIVHPIRLANCIISATSVVGIFNTTSSIYRCFVTFDAAKVLLFSDICKTSLHFFSLFQSVKDLFASLLSPKAGLSFKNLHGTLDTLDTFVNSSPIHPQSIIGPFPIDNHFSAWYFFSCFCFGTFCNFGALTFVHRHAQKSGKPFSGLPLCVVLLYDI